MIKFLTILILVTGMAYGAEEAPKLSQADQSAIDKAIESSLAEPQKAYQAYQAALVKAQDKAIKDLEKLKAGAMKGNNLPLAVAIDGKIAEVKKGALGGVIVERAEKSGDLLGGDEKKVDVAKAIAGKWKSSNRGTVWTLNSNGTFSTTSKGDTGVLEFKKDGSIVATCTNSNWVNTLKIVNNTSILGKCENGSEFTLTKAE